MDGRARARGGGRRRADARDAARGDAKARLKGGHAGGSGEGIYLLRLRAARGLQPDYLKARPTSFVCSLIMLPRCCRKCHVHGARSVCSLYRRCAHCPLIGSLVYLYCTVDCTHAPRGGVKGGSRVASRAGRGAGPDPRPRTRTRSPRSASIDRHRACVRASPRSRFAGRFSVFTRFTRE